MHLCVCVCVAHVSLSLCLHHRFISCPPRWTDEVVLATWWDVDMQMSQRTSSHMHTAASEAHTHRDITFRHFLFIHIRASISIVVRSCAHKHQHTVKSDIRLESHFLIIHKYSSLSVHECHVNEHRQGGEREGGRGVERRLREKKKHTIRGRERPRGNERKREGWGKRERQAGWNGGERRVSVTSRWECFCPSFHYLPVSLPGSPQHRHDAEGMFEPPAHKHTHTYAHPPLPVSLHPVLFTELDREGKKKQMVKEHRDEQIKEREQRIILRDNSLFVHCHVCVCVDAGECVFILKGLLGGKIHPSKP